MSDILVLPPELIAQIFQCLLDEDVFAARISNKQLERACFSHFAKRFFRKKGFMITTRSLNALESISNHDGLNRYVQHVWFNPDCYTFLRPSYYDSRSWHGEDYAEENSPTIQHDQSQGDTSIPTSEYQAWQDCKNDYESLLWEGKLEHALVRTFRKLPNLQTIGMRRSEDYSPWGWRQLQNATGQDPRILGPIPSGPAYSLSAPTQLFLAIINAVAETNVKMKRLYTDAIEVDNIETERLSLEKLKGACSSLLYLEVNAVKAWLNHNRRLGGDYNTLSDPAEFGSGLARLFAAAPQLHEMGLQIFPDRRQSHLLPPRARDPESWRQSYPYLALAKLTQSATMSFLTRIKLEKVASSSGVLLSLLEPCAARLTSLKLRDIRLLSSEEDPQPWRTIFSFLDAQCQSLEYILFYHLMYDRGGVSFVKDLPEMTPSTFENYLLNLAPESHGGRAVFMQYNDVTLEEVGRESVSRRLREVIHQHWYQKPLMSYSMDEETWHTDTSDEDW